VPVADDSTRIVPPTRPARSCIPTSPNPSLRRVIEPAAVVGDLDLVGDVEALHRAGALEQALQRGLETELVERTPRYEPFFEARISDVSPCEARTSGRPRLTHTRL
jgi:hypothetical protein